MKKEGIFLNILFCSVGRRCELLKNFRKSLSLDSRIIVTDMSNYAPAIYFADSYYLVPSIFDSSYLDNIIEICKKEKIDVITTLIDPEIEILSQNRSVFENMGITVLAPYLETATLCYDKYALYQYLKTCDIATATTFDCYKTALNAIESGELSFPVFVKPRTGSGSVGARKIFSADALYDACQNDPSLIIQEYMDCIDLDADIYVDTISHKPVSIFTKKKLESKIGGASKTISFKDSAAVEFICNALKHFNFSGPIDMDLFYKDGQYYLSEINPRFGGAYLHAYGAGVDFIKLIQQNVRGIVNEPIFNNYDENVVMMMYDSVVIKKITDE